MEVVLNPNARAKLSISVSLTGLPGAAVRQVNGAEKGEMNNPIPGCHADVINNIMFNYDFPYHRPNTWDHLGTIEQIRATMQRQKRVLPPEITTLEEYEAAMPVRDGKPHYGFGWDFLTEEQKEALVSKYLPHFIKSTYIFVPVVNYACSSRYASENRRNYVTSEVVKILMKIGGGSWWGLPVTRNKQYGVNFGNGMSLHQVVVWNPNPSIDGAFLIKGTQFQRHADGSRFGPLRTPEEILDLSSAGKDRLAKKPSTEELHDELHTNYKKYIENLTSNK